MKKLLVVIAMVAAGFTANAQGQFNLGANVGLPLGDSADATSFMFSVESNYLFEVGDGFKVGPSLSYLHFIGKDLGDVLKDQLKKVGLTDEQISKLGTDKLEQYAKQFGASTSTDSSVLPIALAARFNASEQFTLGADLGYAVNLGENASGGSFYYRPLVGYNFSETSMLQLAYSGFDGGGAVTLGVMFGL